MRKFKTWRDPYGRGFSTTRKREIEIQEGVTILVGCNGAGKSTLLRNIEESLEKDNIPCMHYDNRIDGDKSTRRFDFEYLSAMMSSSEGENISVNLNYLMHNIKLFIDTGYTREQKEREQWNIAFLGDKYIDRKADSKEKWILFDAIDSGYSIDKVIELKLFLEYLVDVGKQKGLSIYVLVSANEYELVDGSNCFDVISGKYITFSHYAEFKKFILHTRDLKNRREEKAQVKESATDSRHR